MTGVGAGVLVALTVLTTAAPVYAQSGVGALVYGTYGAVSLASSDTFDAVAGTSRASSFGVGGEVTRLWRQLFVDVGYSRQSLDGERVFVSNGTVYTLGIPLEIKFQPIDLAAGWRLDGRVAVYGGAGMTWIKYTETSDFAQAGDNVDARKSGLLILAGIDVPLGRWIMAGGEFRYRAVKGVLGEGGASAAFAEDQLGGVSYAVRVSVGR